MNPKAVQLGLVAELGRRCEAEAMRVLAAAARVPGQPEDMDLARSTTAGELMGALGVTRGAAQGLAELARRLTLVLPDALAALAAGRLDLPRARVLAEATELLDAAGARRVARWLLPGAVAGSAAGDAPWAGPSPRGWRSRVERAVITADPAAARRRRDRALAEREVRAWPGPDGTGQMHIRAAHHDIVVADAVIADLARAWPTNSPDGQPLSMDQRRVDSLIDIFHRIHHGRDLPHLPVRRDREIGLVLHADTFFDHPGEDHDDQHEHAEGAVAPRGPAAHAPGLLRGLGPPAPIDPASARAIAREQIAHGRAVQVLLTDTAGTLQRLVRLTTAPDGGRTRPALIAAVRAALPALQPLATDHAHRPARPHPTRTPPRLQHPRRLRMTRNGEEPLASRGGSGSGCTDAPGDLAQRVSLGSTSRPKTSIHSA